METDAACGKSHCTSGWEFWAMLHLDNPQTWEIEDKEPATKVAPKARATCLRKVCSTQGVAAAEVEEVSNTAYHTLFQCCAASEAKVMQARGHKWAGCSTISTPLKGCFHDISCSATEGCHSGGIPGLAADCMLIASLMELVWILVQASRHVLLLMHPASHFSYHTMVSTVSRNVQRVAYSFTAVICNMHAPPQYTRSSALIHNSLAHRKPCAWYSGGTKST